MANIQFISKKSQNYTTRFNQGNLIIVVTTDLSVLDCVIFNQLQRDAGGAAVVIPYADFPRG